MFLFERRQKKNPDTGPRLFGFERRQRWGFLRGRNRETHVGVIPSWYRRLLRGPEAAEGERRTVGQFVSAFETGYGISLFHPDRSQTVSLFPVVHGKDHHDQRKRPEDQTDAACCTEHHDRKSAETEEGSQGI